MSDRDFADYRSRQTGTGRLTLEHAKTLTTLHEKASTQVKDALAGGALEDLVQRAARDRLTPPAAAAARHP